MDEQFDIEIEPSLDMIVPEIVEPEVEFEPFEDAPTLELPFSEQELSELQTEADALDIEPLEEPEPLAETFDPIQEVPIDYDMVFDGLDEYDFDGINVNQNSEQLNYLLDGFQEDNWSNLDLDGQKEKILGLYDYVSERIGLESPPSIEYYQGEQGEYGGYNPTTNTLSINETMLHEADEASDTVAHELWHAYQHERAFNPQSPKDFQYQFGFDNYIRPGDDFDAYQSQLVESEARAFADQFRGRNSA